MKAKYREITLLALALAMVCPACAVNVLCADCCGSPRIVRGFTECPCCRSPQEDPLRTVDAPAVDDTACVGDRPACQCVDGPMDFSATRSTEKTGLSVVPMSKGPVADLACGPSRTTLSALHRAPVHPPAGIDLLSSIVLRI
jgi:hypothetical protein